MDEDAMAVVEGQGRGHGVHGLRVADASIMPLIATANLNAPTLMMAEKLADKSVAAARCHAAQRRISSTATPLHA